MPFFVEKLLAKGKDAIGLTGEDLFREYLLRYYRSRLQVLKIIKWNDKRAQYNKPVLALIGPETKNLDNIPKEQSVAIASKYKFLAKRYLNLLEDTRGFCFQKFYFNGSVETSCSAGISDLVIDIVYTGRTIQEQGLKVYDKIFESNFVIIGEKR